MNNTDYLKNPESFELQEYIDNSAKGVYGQYSDKGICFFPRDKYTIDQIHQILDTRGDVKPLCIIIDKNYRMSYTDSYRGVGVRNIAELAYMYTYLKKYRFLDQKFINNVYKGIRYVIDLKNNENHPRRKEAVDIINDHPLLRKFLKGLKVGLAALIPVLGSIGLMFLKKKYLEDYKERTNQQLIESLQYHTYKIN